MDIEWNTVTWYSKIAALIIFIGTFILAFYLGMQWQQAEDLARQAVLPPQNSIPHQPAVPKTVSFTFIGPPEGTTLCRDKLFPLTWSASSTEIERVDIAIAQGNSSTFIGEFPLTYNDTGDVGIGVLQWQVGTVQGLTNTSTKTYTLSDGDLYHISVKALGASGNVLSTVDVPGTFNIQTCQG